MSCHVSVVYTIEISAKYYTFTLRGSLYESYYDLRTFVRQT